MSNENKTTESTTKTEVKTEVKFDGLADLFKNLLSNVKTEDVKVVKLEPTEPEDVHSCECEFKKEILRLIVGYLKTMRNQHHDSDKYFNNFIHLKHALQVYASIDGTEPKLHWKLPIFDTIIEHGSVWTTHSMPAQSLTTKDGKDIVVKGIIKYRVVDMKVFALEVWDAVDAISDMAQGIIFDIVKDKTWDELQHEDLKRDISRKARAEAKRWGIEIETVTLSDLAKIKSIRLLNDAGSIS